MENGTAIGDVARAAGISTRTLRHYDAIGLLAPSGVGSDGRRSYDDDALVRLQRILLLRELGLGLAEIAAVLDRQDDESAALRTHLRWLVGEQERIGRQIASVERTLAAREKGEELMANQTFDGFDHTAHRDEVVDRWGESAYTQADGWWRGIDDEQRTAWQASSAALAADWTAAAGDGVDPTSDRAQALAARHVAWLGSIPGTPGAGGRPVRGYIDGLGDMYVDDERFAENYGGQAGAAFVRDALHAWTAANLGA